MPEKLLKKLQVRETDSHTAVRFDWSDNSHDLFLLEDRMPLGLVAYSLRTWATIILTNNKVPDIKNECPPEESRDIKFFIDNYQSKTCVCGGYKDGISFCFECYKVLPEELREGLSGPLGEEEYQWHWNKCYDHLKEIGSISVSR